MESFCPLSVFTSVDLPALGLPITLIKPDLCSMGWRRYDISVKEGSTHSYHKNISSPIASTRPCSTCFIFQLPLRQWITPRCSLLSVISSSKQTPCSQEADNGHPIP